MRQFSDEFIASLSDEQKDMLLRSIQVEDTEEYVKSEKLEDPHNAKAPKQRKKRRKKPRVKKNFQVERDSNYRGSRTVYGGNIKPMDPGGHRNKKTKTPDYVPTERDEASRRNQVEVKCSVCGKMFKKDANLIYQGSIYHRCDKCTGS